MLFCVTTRIRLPRPRWISPVARTPASSVLPRPTASAMRIRVLGCLSPWSAGSSWYGTRFITARWPSRMHSSFGTERRNWLSRNRSVESKRDELSRTNSVLAGSSTEIGPSSLVRKRAFSPRTSSEIPSHASSCPPSDDRSTRRTRHSSSRI